MSRAVRAIVAILACVIAGHALAAGPYNADFPAGGDGLSRPLPATLQRLNGDWTIYSWINARPGAVALVGGVGRAPAAAFLTTGGGRAGFWNGTQTVSVSLGRVGWHFVAAAAHGGKVTLWIDGKAVRTVTARPVAATTLHLAPRGEAGFAPFAGQIAGFTVLPRAVGRDEIAALTQGLDPALVVFDTGSPIWPPQVSNATGLLAPQDAATLPQAKTPPSAPVAVPAYAGPALLANGPRRWTLAKWSLASALDVAASGATLSRPGVAARGWTAATMPGTVLTTLVDRGVYPDPAYGLNNTIIPDSLGRHDWWYRSEFTAPADLPARQRLVFDGINYTADIWLNGAPLGTIRGAFTRGDFDVTGKLARGVNTVAVRIAPPLHPGIAHEQSIAAGVGFNGGMQALDGPTFFATEGWDWIPGIRDRNIGLWQGVSLTGTGPLRLGDPQIVTTLPKADNSVADVEIDVAVENDGGAAMPAAIAARFDDVAVARTVTVAPGETIVRFTSADFPQLAVVKPKLWWPNGYGDPALHVAHLTVGTGGAESDAKDVRFGMRQITYELSLMTPTGNVRRVEVDFARARQRGEQLVDARREGIRKVAGGWVNSLTAAGDRSPAVVDLADTRLAPYLIIRVNGRRIAARGGSWGTDDFMKRSSREHLEPFFRLHRDAHVNIIRNWVGQNTEQVFYDLADEYGLLITNDFWASTQDYQMEPEDPALFLANAEDTIRHFRNHPSIAIWFGRNEGVPPRLINEGLERLTRTLDGTRWYTGSSNSVNLWTSGPYDYREPATYFTEHTKGFAVEVGSQSFPTLEAFEAMVPPADRWPIGDMWAYHDWHQDGNGDTHKFMAAMTAKLGAPTGLADFERKAQLMNYDTYRAIMEGMNAELWSRTSGRMLWMTQPAWPSMMWQIMSHDYDTHAAFYGFKAAAEPVHVQLTLPDHRLQLVNNTAAALVGVHVTATMLGLDGHPLGVATATLTAPAGQVASAPAVDLGPDFFAGRAVVVALDAAAVDGTVLSHNVYWFARDDAAMRALDTMPAQTVTVAATPGIGAAGESRIVATVHNAGPAPALNVKLTLKDGHGARILPAYYSDNYVSLLPGETRRVTVDYPERTAAGAQIALRGWNVAAVPPAPVP